MPKNYWLSDDDLRLDKLFDCLLDCLLICLFNCLLRELLDRYDLL